MLLDIIGPAVLVTHSAGAPAGWFAAAERPGAVKGIVAIEPLADVGGLGKLERGLTYAPLDDAIGQTSAEFQIAPPVVAGFDALPIAVVVGSAAQSVEWAPATVAFLRRIGADAAMLNLADRGHFGNGHGLIFERNSAGTPSRSSSGSSRRSDCGPCI